MSKKKDSKPQIPKIYYVIWSDAFASSGWESGDDPVTLADSLCFAIGFVKREDDEWLCLSACATPADTKELSWEYTATLNIRQDNILRMWEVCGL